MTNSANQPAERRSGPPVVLVEVSPGELIDKLTILRIKRDRITDTGKLVHIRAELAALEGTHDRALSPSPELTRLTAELRAINEKLWEIEDAIRLCEREQDFGPRFVELARAVYHRNDERAALKRRINELLGAAFGEQKSYASYQPPTS